MRTLFILCTLYAMTDSFNYCSLTCDKVQHTMCSYPAGGGPKCQKYNMGLTDFEKAKILFLHNKLRQNIATGRDPKQPQPLASNMMEMIWNEELEAIAQRWADQCTQNFHDGCRTSSDGTEVGQNIAYGWAYGYKFDRMTNISGWVEDFYREGRLFSSEEIGTFHVGSDFEKIGHYTQMVWAATDQVGCGLSEYKDDRGMYWYKFVCDYKPAGNVEGLSVYLEGNPCSKCPTNTSCSSTRPGLCSYF